MINNIKYTQYNKHLSQILCYVLVPYPDLTNSNLVRHKYIKRVFRLSAAAACKSADIIHLRIPLYNNSNSVPREISMIMPGILLQQ